MAEQADTTSGLRDAYRRAVAAAEPSAAEAPTAEPPVTPAHPGHDLDTTGARGTVTRPGGGLS